MTFANLHFYTGFVLETYIHFMTTLTYDRNTSTFGVNGSQKFQNIMQVFNNHYMP